MWEEINLLQTILSGGPSLILAVGIIIVWRTWRGECKEHEAQRDVAENRVRELQEKRIADQEKRVQDALSWSSKYNDLANEVKQSMAVMDRFMETVEHTVARKAQP